MDRSRATRYALFVAVNLLFIWGNSMLPGSVSGQLSRFAADFLSLFGQLPSVQSEGGHHLLRKLAHFSEFACLGFLLYRLVLSFGWSRLHAVFPALLGGLSSACVDETIQLFSPDRGSSLIDVWIDTAGVSAGIALAAALLFIRKNKKQSYMEETK